MEALAMESTNSELIVFINFLQVQGDESLVPTFGEMS